MGEQSKEVRGSSSSRENAEEGGRMKVASSVDVLSELVWSPRNGLTLRCADFSFTGKPQLLSPNFFHHIGQQHTYNNNNTEKIMSTQQEDDALVDERNQACNEMNIPLSGVGDSVENMEPEREEMDDDKVETNDDSGTRVASSKRSLGNEEPEALLANEQLRSQEEVETSLDAERLEATDENDLASKALVACESRGDEAGPSGSQERLLAKAKGKEKAVSDGNFDGKDDESFGSVESCNSAGLLLRGGKKRAPGFEQQLILGSKRLKTLSQECLGSTSKLNHDSSFMNWISNMTKGIWKGSEEDDNSPFVALNTTTSDANAQQELSPSGCRNTGFQSFFQSIYCPKKRGQAMDSLQEVLPLIPEQCLITKGDQLSSSGNDISSGNKLEDKDPNISPSKSKPSEEQKTCNEAVEKVTTPYSGLQSKTKTSEEQKTCGEANEKVTPCLANRNSGLESLWISRFSSKPSFPQKKTNEVAKDDILPIVSSLRIESSEAMASLFARRLEAMKHIMPSGEKAEEGEKTVRICFYCGKKGHRLQDCLQVTDTELRDLVQNISARNGKEEASGVCIRCFQLSHWAATCPNAPLYSPGVAEDRVMKHALASTSGTKLPFTGFTDVPKPVFDAVQILRLTRTDVLKWINSKKSVLGLEGFFLRLRLGKWEEGLGGTGYHVARIDGATEGQSSRKHSVNGSIPVKVGGMSCYVESQFISNKDFLEEELKAWWRSTGKSAGRSSVDSFPSAEELSRKIQQRKLLGV
ncbi:Zinc knuckle [Hirschfeldia incana]|nr:Zinc knuckle [Hirschfeldia incana]